MKEKLQKLKDAGFLESFSIEENQTLEYADDNGIQYLDYTKITLIFPNGEILTFNQNEF